MVTILLNNSHITKTQLETFLIDVLANNIGDNHIDYESKAKLRLIGKGVSRGSFNRTLAQARKNIIKSLYTIILLGYLGILENPLLDPYIEIASKIRTYSEVYRDSWTKKHKDNEHLRIISILKNEIEKGLIQLANPSSISDRS